MTLTIDAVPAPLRIDADGVVRVGGTRVTIDTVVEAFRDGASAEEIALQYPVLALADVYAVLAYYLRRREEVDAFLAERAAASARIRAEVPPAMTAVRDRLLARRRAPA